MEIKQLGQLFKTYSKPNIKTSLYENKLYGEDNRGLKYLVEERKLLPSTLQKFHVGFTGKEIAIPIFKDNELIDYKFRSIIGKEFRRWPNGETWVFNEEAFETCKDDKYLIIAEGECLSDDTEILTPKGWLPIKDYHGEMVAQWEDGTSKFVKPLTFIKKEYCGDMINFYGSIDLLVTPKHKVLYNTKVDGDKIAFAKDVEHSLGSFYRTTDLDTLGINLTDWEIRLQVAIQADCGLENGYTNKTHYNSDGKDGWKASFIKIRKIRRLKEILRNLNIPYKIYSGRNNFGINGENEVIFRFRTEHQKYTKIFSDDLYQMNRGQREIFYRELFFWDGGRTGGVSGVGYKYSTAIKSNADIAQWACSMSNIYANYFIESNRENGRSPLYCINISSLSQTRKRGRHNLTSAQSTKKRIVKYDGTVYCVQVESGFIIIRRNNDIVVTGNCDVLSLYQLGFKSVISGTGGVQSKTPWVEKIPDKVKVFIATDNDDPGDAGAEELAERIGIERCYRVRYPQKDANDFLVSGGTKEEFKKILYSSEKFRVKDVFRIDEVIESLKKNKVQKVHVFSDRLTSHLNGGAPRQGVVTIGASPKIGKCHGKGTKLLMHDGSIKNVEHIIVGDKLMGPDSKIRNVISTTSGVGNLYRIDQKRGKNSYIVNENHILSLKRYRKCGWVRIDGRYQKNPRIIREQPEKLVNISVKKFLKYSLNSRRRLVGWGTGVEWPHKNIKLDPYFLGIWLGDGTSSNPGITTADKEIVNYIYDIANKNNWNVRVLTKTNKENKSKTYVVSKHYDRSGPTYILKELSILNNKHIPKDYLINSRKNRLKLLAGLIDSDGYLNCNGDERPTSYEIIQKSKKLTDDIIFLARSLGFHATYKICTKTIKSINFKGSYHRIYISGKLSEIPVLLERKKCKVKSVKNVLNGRISITPIGIGEYYGFEIDKNGLYLLEDFTVTHNSSLLNNILIGHADKGLPVLLISLENDLYMTIQRILETKLRKPFKNFTDEDWEYIKNGMKDYPFYIDTSMGNYTVDKVEKIVSQMRKIYGIEVLGFDHLGYLSGEDAKDLEATMKGIKMMSRNHNIITYVIVHTNRDHDENEHVTGHNLKGSSSMAQESNIVLMLNKPKTGMYISIDMSRMSKSKLDIPIIFDGDSGYMYDDMDRPVKSYDEEIPEPEEVANQINY